MPRNTMPRNTDLYVDNPDEVVDVLRRVATLYYEASDIETATGRMDAWGIVADRLRKCARMMAKDLRKEGW